ncbi:hypothetical protein AaE_016223 [Aphanomyces astaci]|uniref:Protein kinase domain-containing protein n=1 Tax=Aphanomyces astaci TaxID=112090 RepID=A0A6A4YYT9_APHAT|nr:hypothetical protein AaE_016223 [Aphanomyces astaci]
MSAAPCPYGSMNASRIFVAGPLCKGNVSDVCVVDSKCALVTKNISSVGIEGTITMTYVNGYKTGWDSVDAIGDLSNLSTIGLSVVNFTKLNIDAITFSRTLQYLYGRDQVITPLFPPPDVHYSRLFDNMSIPVIPETLNYTDRLGHLLFIETNTSNIPKTLPVNLFDWTFLYQPLNTDTLPNIPYSVQYLFLHKNKLQEISNVKFKKGMLKSFVLSDANISHFELDLNSFGALDSLGPFQILNQSFFDAQEYGFRMNISNITQDAQKCDAVKGVVTELWSLHAAINKKTYSVCVVNVTPPPAATTLLPTPAPTVASSSNTGLTIVGVAIGVVILVAAMCFFIRRRNRKRDAEFEYQREGGKSAGGTTTTRFITDNTATARTSVDFTWNEKIHVIAAIVDALAYLHSMPVIHRDLKSRNVLLDSVKSAKLTDFGVSKEDTQETMTVGVGTYRWMAPEILQVNHYSVAADMFSFGMILSELDTHNIPYADQCIATDPEDRPTAMMLSNVVRKQIKRETHQLGV